MKTKILSFIISAVMIMGSITNVFANREITELTIEKAQFNTGESVELQITGVTPAKFGQLVSVIVYKPSAESDMSILLQSDDPASLDIPSPDRIVRVAETVADTNGAFEIVIPFEDEEDGVLLVKVSGGGSVALASPETYTASAVVSYISDMSVVYDKFWEAGSTELETLIENYQLPLNLELGEDFEVNKSKLAMLFVTARTDDVTEKFNSSDSIRNVYNSAKYILELGDNPTADELKFFVKSNSQSIENAIKDYNGTENEPVKGEYSLSNEDYTVTNEKEYEVLATIFAETPAMSMTSMAKLITQSAGIVLMNQKNGTTIVPVVKKYGAVLGVSADDYAVATEAYGEYEVNKAFVEKNFSTPAQVVAAFKARVAELEALDKDTDTGEKDGYQNSSSGSSGGGFGGGSGGNKKDESEYDSSYTEPEIAEPIVKTLFTDFSEQHWAANAVSALTEKEVINGFSDGSFRPDDYVTREQFIKMLMVAVGAEIEDGTADFDDVERDRWSASYIFTAVNKQVINGIGDKKFAPDKSVTRQDAAVMITRCCDAYGLSFSDGIKTATDGDSVAEYAKVSVGRLLNAGIITGFEDGSFRPAENLTRAQATKLIYELIK